MAGPTASTVSTARKSPLPVSAADKDDEDRLRLRYQRLLHHHIRDHHHHQPHHHHLHAEAKINADHQQQCPSPPLKELLLLHNPETGEAEAGIPVSGGEDGSLSVSVVGPPALDRAKETVEDEEPSSSTSHCYQTALSDFVIGARPSEAKDSCLTTGGSAGSGAEGRKTSDGSEECSTSSGGSSSLGISGWSKPHKGNDARWEAIRVVRSRDGELGFRHFRVLNLLGSGDIGTVYLAELSGTRCLFAMKVMNKESLAGRKKLLRAQMEREILECLDHPFLPTLYSNFETERHSCLVMEYCPGGDLHSLRQRQPSKYFSEQAVRFYVAEVLLALEYLHMLGIVYRDLKPENVLVREDGHIMLSDFDLSLRCTVSPTLIRSSNSDGDNLKNPAGYCVQASCIMPSCNEPSCMRTTCFTPAFHVRRKSKKNRKAARPKRTEISNQLIPELVAEPTNARSLSFVGTHEYLAPEIIKGEGHGSAVDWWTFGIFLYELLFGTTPFRGPENRATLFNVVGEPLKFPDTPMVSFAARDLIRGLLVKEPQQRLAYRRGATEVKQHPFFQSMNWALIRCTSPPEVPKLCKNSHRQPLAAGGSSNDASSAGKFQDIDFF